MRVEANNLLTVNLCVAEKKAIGNRFMSYRTKNIMPMLK